MVKIRETKPWALRRALQGSELLLDANSTDQFMLSASQAFAHHGDCFGPDEYELIRAGLKASHARMVQYGYDLGHAVLGIRQGSEVVAGTHVVGHFSLGDDGGLCAAVEFMGTFALPDRDAAITEQYGQRLQPAMRVEVGERLLAYYEPNGIGVQFLTEPANDTLHDYYAWQGFADTTEIGENGNALMVLPVNPETIGHLADLARVADLTI
jgi:hypothetical protein